MSLARMHIWNENALFMYVRCGETRTVVNAKQVHMIRTFFPTQVKLVQMAYHIIYGLSDCFVGFSFYSGKKGEIFHLETHMKSFDFGIMILLQTKSKKIILYVSKQQKLSSISSIFRAKVQRQTCAICVWFQFAPSF